MVKTLQEKAYNTSNPLRSSAFVLTNFSSIILSRAAAHSYYSGFNRIYKRYQTNFNLQSSTNQVTEFLSAPGIVHPLDGIQLCTNSHLVTNITYTFGIAMNEYQNYNKSLYCGNYTGDELFNCEELIASVPAWLN